ncbi:MAG: hypothetical protein KBT68_02935, partial [bacterium]|nr:hypothetical protein [Candidatus Colisoma equi]
SGWASLQTLGEIVASGKTIVLDTKTNKIVLNGPVSASLEKTGAGTATVGPTVEAPCGGEDETISISEGTLEIGAKGSWAGKTNTIDGDTAVFSLLRNNCISKTATLTVKNGGKVNLGASAAVAELWVDGVKMDAGVYSAANLSAVFSGTGQMVVGNVKTWCGGSSGLFSESTNWSGGSAPEAGDTLLFDQAVTLTEEAFEVGADGITIICNANVTCTVAFSGEGCVIKKGSKNLSVVAVPTLVGGFRIEDGVLDNGNKNAVTNPLGAVPIEITGTGKFQYNNYYNSLGNAITIHDIQQPQAIVLNGPGSMTSKITANCDFTVSVAWEAPGLKGPISAPGKTVTIDCESGNSRQITISGEIDASLTKTNSGVCTFSGTTVGDTNVLTVAGGTLTIAASKVWSGNEVRVSGTGSVLALSSRDNLTRESIVYVSDGGMLNLAANVKVMGLNVNGLPKESGRYTVQNLPEVIAGSGILTVGKLGLFLVVQ